MGRERSHLFGPGELLGNLCPEAFGVVDGALVHSAVLQHDGAVRHGWWQLIVLWRWGDALEACNGAFMARGSHGFIVADVNLLREAWRRVADRHLTALQSQLARCYTEEGLKSRRQLAEVSGVSINAACFARAVLRLAPTTAVHSQDVVPP